ncbi:zinc finger, CCHC-type containing protein [Tanacetum coccineum]
MPLDSLGRDMKKLKENVHAIQVGCQLCRGPDLDMECALNEEVKKAAKRHVEQDERLKKSYQNTKTNREAQDKIIQGLETKALAALDITPKQVSQEEKQSVSYYVEPYEPPIPFPRRLEHHAKEALIHENMESLKKIKINCPLLKEIRQTENYAKHMKKLVVNKPRTQEDKEIRMNPRCSALLQNQKPPKEQDPGSFILPCSIGRLNFNNALADLGASMSIMPLSMFKHLGMGKLEPINMVIEQAGNTKCTPKGIVENLLYGNVCEMTRERILKDHWRERFGEEEDDIKENLEDPKGYEIAQDTRVKSLPLAIITRRNSASDFLVTTKSKVDFGSGEMRIDLTMLEEERDMDSLLIKLVVNMEEVGSSNGELVKMGKSSRIKNHNVNKLTPPPPPKIEEIQPIQLIPPQPVYHPLSQKQKEKIKEALDRKKKLDEVMMGCARLSNNEFGEEDKIRIVKHGLLKKMCDPGNLCNPRPYNSNLTMAENTQDKAIEEIDEEDDWLSCFEVRRDEDGNPKYGSVAPSFLDIEGEMEIALEMEAYLNPFKNIIVFKKLVDFLGSLLVQLKNTNWGNEGYGMYKKIEGDGAWHVNFEVITPSRQKFTRGFKTKETKRKISGKFTSEDILKFDHFLD